MSLYKFSEIFLISFISQTNTKGLTKVYIKQIKEVIFYDIKKLKKKKKLTISSLGTTGSGLVLAT